MKKLTITLFVAFGFRAVAQPDPAAFETFVQSSFSSFEVPSMTMAVVHKGAVVSMMSLGKKGGDSGGSPNEHTMYGIASLSKAFTAASVGMLVDEGKLDWDDKVIDHLPWFEMHDPYVTQHMTIEDLLCHRSGLITFDGDLLWYGTSYTREEAIKRISRRAPTYEFREEFGYQNLMYMAAGEVIEAVSGMTWEDFVKRRILDPLQMKRTVADFQSFSTDFNIARPHIDGKEIFMLSYDNSGATAALNSAAGDMTAWIKFWLNSGVINGDTLLSADAIENIWSVHTPLEVGRFDEQNGTHFKGYGLGWFLMDYNGKKVVHHGGGLPGYISKLALVPEEELGIIVLTNDMSSISTMLMYAAVDWAMGKDYRKWASTFLSFKNQGEEREAKEKQKRLQTKVENPKLLPLTDYMGTYRDEMYGDAVISMGEDGLIISLLPTKELFTGKMTPWDEHAFQFTHNDPFLTYGIAKFDVVEDIVKGFKIDLPNYDFHFDKLEFKKLD